MLFISYSHENEEFVNQLIARLLQERVAIWYDRIGIKVGESLFEKIQGAIQEADFLAVVLSKASVQSAWCT
ncbi:MAG: toll/interleukin-1 receptor domain-containing protein, partial [Planctomycetes bacterium]|nr:toll/interleukin-1 receptor domain-containing protein [Planctomycetota bacterium]